MNFESLLIKNILHVLNPFFLIFKIHYSKKRGKNSI